MSVARFLSNIRALCYFLTMRLLKETAKVKRRYKYNTYYSFCSVRAALVIAFSQRLEEEEEKFINHNNAIYTS